MMNESTHRADDAVSVVQSHIRDGVAARMVAWYPSLLAHVTGRAALVAVVLAALVWGLDAGREAHFGASKNTDSSHEFHGVHT